MSTFLFRKYNSCTWVKCGTPGLTIALMNKILTNYKLNLNLQCDVIANKCKSSFRMYQHNLKS